MKTKKATPINNEVSEKAEIDKYIKLIWAESFCNYLLTLCVLSAGFAIIFGAVFKFCT